MNDAGDININSINFKQQNNNNNNIIPQLNNKSSNINQNEPSPNMNTVNIPPEILYQNQYFNNNNNNQFNLNNNQNNNFIPQPINNNNSNINYFNNYPPQNLNRPLSGNINSYCLNNQEIINRNQFSDYDFRKKSGGDINEYYNEIRKRKQQIRDQYKQIEQENYLNAQRKKQEKELEKEREGEKIFKRVYNDPPEEFSNLIMRENKLKQKNLIDQINFTRDIRDNNNNNNEDLIKNEKQKKMDDFKKSLDEQVNQKKKMQEIKNMLANKGQKQDIYDMNQQFIEDVKNIQNKYETKPEIIMMNNIISNNNNNNYD